MSDDGVEIRLRCWAIDCWACERSVRHGALHLSGTALLRAGIRHRIGGPGSRPLCEREATR